MPRPKPAPENAPVRRTVSIPRKVAEASDVAIARTPATAMPPDFSEVVENALVEYLVKHHPGLIEETIADIRGFSLKVAEDRERAAYEVNKKQPAPKPPAAPKTAPGKRARG